MNIMTIQKGNPYSAVITVTTNGSAYDLTGKTVFFTLKKSNDYTANDAGALITKNITVHTNPTAGITTLILSDTQTNIAIGEYKADIRIYSAGGVKLNTETFLAKVVDIVTKRTS